MSETLNKDVWGEACSRQSEHTIMSDATLNDDACFVIEYFGLDEDLTEWAALPELLAREAIPLMHGVSPDRWRDGDLLDSVTTSIERCIELAELDGHRKAAPSFWIEWGRKQGLDRFRWEAFPEMDVDRVCLWGLFADLVTEDGRLPPERVESVTQQRVNHILDAIDALGYSATEMPKHKNGHSGAPKKVFDYLTSTNVFKQDEQKKFRNAWDHCLTNKLISYAKENW